MSLVEVLVASLVLAVASGSSLQIWAASVAATRATEQRSLQLLLLDRLMLEAEAQQRLAIPAASLPCDQAAAWLAAQLQSQPLPAGVTRELQLQSRGLWLQLQVGALPPRRRWLDMAAVAHCGPAAAGAAVLSSPSPDGLPTSVPI